MPVYVLWALPPIQQVIVVIQVVGSHLIDVIGVVVFVVIIIQEEAWVIGIHQYLLHHGFVGQVPCLLLCYVLLIIQQGVEALPLPE